MLKRKRIGLIIIIILLVIPVAIYAFLHLYASIKYRNLELYTVSPEEVSVFYLGDYQKELELFAVDENIGPIISLDDVAYKAQTAWNERFSTVTLTGFHAPNPGTGIEVFFDAKEECWLVRGTAPQGPFPPDTAGWLGSVPNIIIRENGDILAIWLG